MTLTVLLCSYTLSILLLITLIQALSIAHLAYCSNFLLFPLHPALATSVHLPWLDHLDSSCTLLPIIFLKGNAYVMPLPTLPEELCKHVTKHHSWSGLCLLLWPHLPFSLPPLSPYVLSFSHANFFLFLVICMLTLPHLLEWPSPRHVHFSMCLRNRSSLLMTQLKQ